ncbi:AAA domain-containing protein [Glaciecola petra]|uniref:AAA domain-containing protein n=1 Tax=Glaciecola petra TaxID=3075602 RepID=A0ABU2ZRB9_9ALTE|nr:AAA domain-containing protein [Aestuariibacter sp. P117]MDT0594864.1 AAA domain-containing protein [Aestuariibacter sp. P117]
MSEHKPSLEEALDKFDGALPDNDLVHMFAPLMREIAHLHNQHLVAKVHPRNIFEHQDGSLYLINPDGFSMQTNPRALTKVQAKNDSALKVLGNLSVTSGHEFGAEIEDLDVKRDTDIDKIEKPIYLTGYLSWENKLAHHDELTDIFNLGLIMAAAACNLDLNDNNDLSTFSQNRSNLYRLNPRLHPAIANMIEGMTALNRHDRESDITALALRLENYRDQQGRFNSEQLIENIKEIPSRREAILANLRDRLFDLSKRNRLIHFKASQASVNLTVASVPLVMRLESIRKEQLCTWQKKFSQSILSGKPQSLGTWLRFEDQPYLPTAINRLIQQSRKDKAEYGFSSLRLVVGFLHWYNLKEAPKDKISSPLLWLSVDVKKKKGVRDHYMIDCQDTIAEFNPALRHYLKQLYDINLPESVDLAETSLTQIHTEIAAQIAQTEPDVNLDLVEQPSIRLIHQKAVKRLRAFEKRRGKRSPSVSSLANFSYDAENYLPLGRAIFEKHIVVQALPQRSALGEATQSRPDFMTGSEVGADTYVLDKNDTSQYAWEIDLAEVTLANFNYKKMSLVRDYSALIDNSDSLTSLDRLFSIEAKEQEPSLPPALPISNQWNVVPSDMTQDQAVALARQGESFIIQGPPGTGKSQTITNLIADFAAQNKRVLFVCEKRAALDVVFNRLKQAGLEKLACIIHDIQEDKKPFIHDLKAVYETWFEQHSNLELNQAKRERSIQAFTENFAQIEALDRLLNQSNNNEAVSISSLIRQHMSLPSLDSEYSAVIRELLPSMSHWQTHKPLAQRIAQSVKQQFGYKALAGSIYSKLNETLVTQDNAFRAISERIQKAEKLSDELGDYMFDSIDAISESSKSDDEPEVNISLDKICALTSLCEKAVEFNLHNLLSLFNSHSSEASKLAMGMKELAQLQEVVDLKQQAAAHWKVAFSAEDTNNALVLANEKESSIFRLFSSDWRALKKTVLSQYDFSAHAVKPSISSVLVKLDELYRAKKEYEKAEKSLQQSLQTKSLEALSELKEYCEIERLRDPMLDALLNHNEGSLLIQSIAKATSLTNDFSSILYELLSEDSFIKVGQTIKESDFFELQELIRDMRESLDDLPGLLPLLLSTFDIENRTGFVLRHINASVEQMQALIVDETLQKAFFARPELSNFDLPTLANYVMRSAKAREIALEQNAENIVSQRHDLFNQHVRHSTLSVSQLNEKERNFKKLYNTGRREVEHEFGKSMRYRSIRDMASDETGAVVSDLKPIWLMSPLSVSDTLPLEPDLFDVVIFDEASQIPVEDGIPALCRAPQLIVVGDEMQLPPTSFFSSGVDDDDMEIEVQEDGEVLSVLLDADSLLSQAARHLPATLLAWHYRSRSEALISFSNAAFYDGRLVTIPDQVSLAATNAEATQTNEQERVSRLLCKPISYHYIKEGLYLKRSNQAEADVIANMVRDLLIGEENQSIGIVAFSEAQQSCIEDALDKLADDDPQFAGLLEEEYQREDEEQFNGLFVKNLENVQGDERDIIILSICYAPGPNGKMLMNFGPINQRGGEKRLNVIFSRARKHMAVVSSIKSSAITNTHNDGAFALRTFLAFAEALEQKDLAASRVALSSVNPNVLNVFSAKPPQDALRASIVDALSARGHKLETYVGSASFRCDIAIVDEKTGEYKLGILLDSRSAESKQNDGNVLANASICFERYVFKPSILRAFGWRVVDIMSSAWHQSPEQVIAYIEHTMLRQTQEINSEISEEALFETIAMPEFVTPLVNKEADTKLDQNQNKQTDDIIVYECFVFKEGKSDKFWHIAQQGRDLLLHYGRTGTKGQKVTKSYDSDKKAEQQRKRLIREKVRKGYEQQ